MKNVPTKDDLERLYILQRVSPEEIGKLFGITGKTVRKLMREFGIPRLGPSHLRAGKSAEWNKGRQHSEETKEKNRIAHIGKVPHNKGSGRISFACCICGKEVFDKPYRKKHTCSAKCRDIFLASIQGTGHWNYKGEDSGAKQRHRNWSAYREWRSAVFAKDGFTCVKCGQRGGRLSAHHLDSFAAHVDKRFDVSNGVTLCWKCHWSFHRCYGHKVCTADQFHEWITKS